METKLTTSIKIAADFLMKGEVVAFPTETVYGLGANTFNEDAIKKVFKAKGRPLDNPLIVHISRIDDLQYVAKTIPKDAEKFINKFFPGPLTVILPKAERILYLITGGLETVGVRMPNHPITQKFLEQCKIPVVAPSANRSGKPSPTTWQAVYSDLGGRIKCILKGGQTKVGLESTVVDCTGKVPLIVRAGAVSLEQLRAIVPSTRILKSARINKVKSPGMKYRHYAPKAHIKIISVPSETTNFKNSAYIGLTKPTRDYSFKRTKICENMKEYAHSLFKFFRDCDDAQIHTIFCQTVDEKGIGLAIMDRIRRAVH